MNLALDEGDIFMLPSFTTVHMTKILADAIYGDLVKKGFMQDPSTFTMEGVTYLKKVDDYKKAMKYVKIGSVVIGIYKEEFAISLFWNQLNNEFDFSRIQLNDVVKQLSYTYPFLCLDNSEKDTTILDGQITFNTLIEKYSLKYDNTIYLSTLDVVKLREQKKDMVTNEIIFYCYNSCYYYDINQEKLSLCSITQMKDLLRKRLRM